MRRPAPAALVFVVVAAMHIALLWLLVTATQPHERAAGPARSIAMVEVMQAPTEQAKPLAPPTQAAARAPSSATPTNARRMPADTVRSRTITEPGVRPEPSTAPTAPPAAAHAERPVPAAPPPLILDSDSTRRALRDLGRESIVVERANQAHDSHPRPAFDSRWSAGVAGAARGDCRKGEFKGNGMGLLSLPALALAVAKGDCGS